jgi:hypothetical protein
VIEPGKLECVRAIKEYAAVFALPFLDDAVAAPVLTEQQRFQHWLRSWRGKLRLSHDAVLPRVAHMRSGAYEFEMEGETFS